MTRYKVAIMEGDGIGPEIVKETIKALNAVQSKFDSLEFEYMKLDVGLNSYEKNGDTLPIETREGLRECDAAILGPLTTHIYDTENPNMVNPSGTLRKEFDLYANIRPAKNYPGVQTRYENVDLVIVRENTEGMYSDRNLHFNTGEFMPDPDTVLSFRLVTRKASERLAKIGFELANARKKSVTIVHKMNVLRKGCGLFYDSAKKIGEEEYEAISVNDYHVDAFALHLVQKPETFDVVITTNMFGDILSDQAAGLVGGLGLAPGLNLGDSFLIAQATHGSAPDIAGKNIANPIAEILSAKMMLEWIGIRNDDDAAIKAAALIDRSIEELLKKGLKTADIGGTLSTEDFGNALVQTIEEFSLVT